MTMTQDPAFWLLVAFVICVLLITRPIYQSIQQIIHDRTVDIKNQFDEAISLRDDSRSLLNIYRKKVIDVRHESQEILRHAQSEADLIKKNAERDLELFSSSAQRRMQQKLTALENQYIDLLKEHVISRSMKLAINILGKEGNLSQDTTLNQINEKILSLLSNKKLDLSN